MLHTFRSPGGAGRVGVGYRETGASNWSLETEIHQLEPYTYRVCVCVYTYASACLHPNVNTHTHRWRIYSLGCARAFGYNLIVY